MRDRLLLTALSIVILGIGGACSDAAESPGEAAEDVMQEAEAVATGLGENVENSAKVMEEAYDDARKKGENAVNAAGEAYNEVLEIPQERH
jgi:hypothetical protein